MNIDPTSSDNPHHAMLNVGDIKLDNPTVLAPLAGITNLPFRLMVKSTGCALVYSEMISSHGLVHGSAKTHRLMSSCKAEHPLAVQIFGADPPTMAEAARIVEQQGGRILDINLGCSVKKIVKTGAGVALMDNAPLAEKMFTTVRNAIGIPLTIKIRSGWNASGQQAVAIAKIAQDCGVNAVAVHPRTATQAFAGKADWSVIAAVKNAVSIPVIGNGDIQTAQDAVDMIRQTGCDAVMIGRAAMANPLIFSQILALLNRTQMPAYHLSDRFALMRQYLKQSVAYFGEAQACRMMRSRLGWFVKGLHQNGVFRQRIKHLASEREALALMAQYHALLVRDTRNRRLPALQSAADGG